MIYRVIRIGGITEDKHELNKIHKKKENKTNITQSFQSILDDEKIKYDKRLPDKNIK